MVYDEGLAQRLREQLVEEPGLTEREMFGGIGFMLDGNMAAGVLGDELLVRVGPQGHDQAMADPHTRAFDFTGRPMKGWAVVAADGYEADEALAEWVAKGVAFARSLPPK